MNWFRKKFDLWQYCRDRVSLAEYGLRKIKGDEDILLVPITLDSAECYAVLAGLSLVCLFSEPLGEVGDLLKDRIVLGVEEEGRKALDERCRGL